jgi:hypothetical protein
VKQFFGTTTEPLSSTGDPLLQILISHLPDLIAASVVFEDFTTQKHDMINKV